MTPTIEAPQLPRETAIYCRREDVRMNGAILVGRFTLESGRAILTIENDYYRGDLEELGAGLHSDALGRVVSAEDGDLFLNALWDTYSRRDTAWLLMVRRETGGARFALPRTLHPRTLWPEPSRARPTPYPDHGRRR